MVFRMVPLSQFYDSKPFCDSNPIAYKLLINKIVNDGRAEVVVS